MENKKRKQIRDTKNTIIIYKDLYQNSLIELGYLTYKMYNFDIEPTDKRFFKLFKKLKRFDYEINHYYDKLNSLTMDE